MAEMRLGGLEVVIRCHGRRVAEPVRNDFEGVVLTSANGLLSPHPGERQPGNLLGAIDEHGSGMMAPLNTGAIPKKIHTPVRNRFTPRNFKMIFEISY